MLGHQYKTFEHGEEFDTLEEAILTSCPYCGTELEWSLTVDWHPYIEAPVINGTAFSCGVEFKILRNVTSSDLGYILIERGKEWT